MRDEPADPPADHGGRQSRRRRLVDQFSRRGDRSDIWRCLDLVVDTDGYLNLGYADRYRPYPVGDPQRRLVGRIGSAIESSLGDAAGDSLLDVGCGRGGPAVLLAEHLDADVTGVDVVTNGLATARANTVESAADPSFVAGDAVALPIVDGAFDAATAIDAIVYVPEKTAAFEELARVTCPGGAVVVSDLVVADGSSAPANSPVNPPADPPGDPAIDAFAAAWDMPPIPSLEQYLARVGAAGLIIESVEDVSSHSIDRFRKWSGLALLVDEHAGRLVERGLRRRGLDAGTVTDQIRRAHEAIPHLRHVIVRARVK